MLLEWAVVLGMGVAVLGWVALVRLRGAIDAVAKRRAWK